MPVNIKRLQAHFPKELKEARFLPLPKDEDIFVAVVKRNLPYYILAYGGNLVSHLPYIGSALSIVINQLARYYRVETKTIL